MKWRMDNSEKQTTLATWLRTRTYIVFNAKEIIVIICLSYIFKYKRIIFRCLSRVDIRCCLQYNLGWGAGLWCLTSLSTIFKIDRGRENHKPAASHCHTLSHNIVSSTPRSVFGYLRGVVLRIHTSGQTKDNKWYLLPLH